MILALSKSVRTCVVDEIQKVPKILDEIHQLIENDKVTLQFALTGSSARKLKAGGANLLAGRAVLRSLFPLTPLDLWRPTEELKPDDVILQQAYTLINGGDATGALEIVNGYASVAEYNQHWANYIRGLALFAAQNLEDGLQQFLVPYSVLSLNARIRRTSEHFQLCGKCLKKIGWYYRKTNEFEKAFTYHSMEYTLFEKYGSFADLHDAAVSLGIDAYYLKSPLLEEHWIKVSIAVGKKIPDDQARYAAVGMSYNNLAATQSDLEWYEDAETSAKESLTNWIAYEALAGNKKNRTVWSYYGLADLYQNWATAKVPNDIKSDLKMKAAYAVDSSKVTELNEKIREFHKEILAWAEAHQSPNAVIQLNTFMAVFKSDSDILP